MKFFVQPNHILSPPASEPGVSPQAGFSLMEAIVAIAILLVVVSGIMNLVYQGTQANRLQTDRMTATYLAADAIEYLQYDRDSYWLYYPADQTFHGWTTSATSSVADHCIDSTCRIDTRVGDESIQSCSGSCPPLDYDEDNKQYGYNNGEESRFVRTIETSAHDNDSDSYVDEVQITVTVSFPRPSGEDSEVVLKESMFDYRDSNSNED